MLFSALYLAACTGPTDTGAPDADTPDRLTILHTNDWQSHMLGWGPNAEYSPATTGDDGTVGGLARMKTLVDRIRGESGHPVVLYDAGDWMAGDLFQLLAPTHAAELQMIGAMGYDAITLGNHEFDWGPTLVGEMIARADAMGLGVPIVASNTVPNPDDAGDDALEAHFTSGRIETTRVQELESGLRIGLFGLVGNSAAAITPAIAPASFSDAEDAAAAAVAELLTQDVDIVVGLTHNGVTDDPATSPDDVLAAEVPDIDVVVGGHSHTPLFEHRTVGTTTIVQAGSLTQYLGQLDLVREGDGWAVESYVLHELDDTLAGDPDVTAAVDAFVADLDADVLPALGHAFDSPILSVPADMITASHGTACAESGLGNFVTDAYRQQLTALAPDEPVDFAFESQGVIRDGMVAGASGIEAFSDVFRVLPLGYGTDDVPGYALVDFWVTAAEVQDVCEVTASISPTYGCSYFIEMSGFRCTVDMSRSMFNRAQGVEVPDGDGWVALDTSASNTELYHVTVDSYVASLMGILERLTYGAIVITAKDRDGAPITDGSAMLFDADPATEGVQELKLWQALVGYASTFPDEGGDGVPDVPASYAEPAGRIQGW